VHFRVFQNRRKTAATGKSRKTALFGRTEALNFSEMLALLAASLTIGLPTTPRGQAAPPTLAERRALGQRRIIGGELVEPEDKYFGAQGIYSSAGFLCGSTWLAPSSIQPDDPDAKADWVMTAAHCVNTAADPEDTEVSFFMCTSLLPPPASSPATLPLPS
jgi:hypothetical protein